MKIEYEFGAMLFNLNYEMLCEDIKQKIQVSVGVSYLFTDISHAVYKTHWVSISTILLGFLLVHETLPYTLKLLFHLFT